jgi:hypothetical protein
MKWADWMPTKYSVLCEKHFTTDDYINKGEQVIKDQSKKYLKQNRLSHPFLIILRTSLRQLHPDLFLKREKHPHHQKTKYLQKRKERVL